MGGAYDNSNVGAAWAFESTRPCGYATTVSSTPGLLGYWRLGEGSGTTAEDQLGAHNGIYTGGSTLGAPGAIYSDPNTAVSLDGSTGQVKLPALGSASNWTVEGWTGLNSSASQNPIGNNALYANRLGVRLIIRPGGYYADDCSTGKCVGIDQGRSPTNIGAWVHWVLVRSGSTLTVYRDAVKQNSASLGSEGPSTLNGAIGSDNRTIFLHGGVDEVAVYRSALSPFSILLHYQLGSTP